MEETNVTIHNKSNLTLSQGESWSLMLQGLWTCALYISIAVCGILGNALVIAVVKTNKKMRTPTNVYLVSLAFSDSLFFISALPKEVSEQFTSNYLFGSVGCALGTFITYLNLSASTLSVAAFTVERYIGICHPMRARTICTVRRAIIIVASLWIVSIAYNSVWLYLATTNTAFDDQIKCTFRIDRTSWIYAFLYIFDFIVLYVLPCVLNLVLYINIVLVLRASRAMRGKQQVTTTPSKVLSTGSTIRQQAQRDQSSEELLDKEELRHIPSKRLVCRQQGTTATLIEPSNGKVQFTSVGSYCRRSVSLSNTSTPNSVLIATSTPDSVIGSPTKCIVDDKNNESPRRANTLGVPATGSGKWQKLCFFGDNPLRTLRPTASERSVEKTNKTQVVKMLAIVSLVFAILWFPYRFIVIVNSIKLFGMDFRRAVTTYVTLAKICVYINCAVNPILYNMLSSKFRAASRRFIRTKVCRKEEIGSMLSDYDERTNTRSAAVSSSARSTVPRTGNATRL